MARVWWLGGELLHAVGVAKKILCNIMVFPEVNMTIHLMLSERESSMSSPLCAAEMNPARNHEVAHRIPGSIRSLASLSGLKIPALP